MKICLFGGTFDPPHIGHLLIAQTVYEAENFDKILFIPAYAPPHKNSITPMNHRIEMVKIAISDNPNFEIIPGQLMTVKVIYDEINQIGVPESAVTIQGNTAFVYIVNTDTAEKRSIKMGKRNFGKVSVVSGINEGDMVISEGISKVRNKAKVKVINP